MRSSACFGSFRRLRDFGLIVQQGTVAPTIAQQIVENLRQLVGIHQRVKIARFGAHMDRLSVSGMFSAFLDKTLQLGTEVVTFTCQPPNHANRK